MLASPSPASSASQLSTPTLSLPLEILFLILERPELDYLALKRLQRVCRTFKRHIETSRFDARLFRAPRPDARSLWNIGPVTPHPALSFPSYFLSTPSSSPLSSSSFRPSFAPELLTAHPVLSEPATSPALSHLALVYTRPLYPVRGSAPTRTGIVTVRDVLQVAAMTAGTDARLVREALGAGQPGRENGGGGGGETATAARGENDSDAIASAGDVTWREVMYRAVETVHLRPDVGAAELCLHECEGLDDALERRVLSGLQHSFQAGRAPEGYRPEHGTLTAALNGLMRASFDRSRRAYFARWGRVD
ncbi:hypothetical protein JCM10207_001250 [Rhodosporidiobolus poonsookiae]